MDERVIATIDLSAVAAKQVPPQEFMLGQRIFVSCLEAPDKVYLEREGSRATSMSVSV